LKAHENAMIKNILLLVFMISPGVLCMGQTSVSYDTAKIIIEKHCESIYEVVDAGQKPPRPKKIYKYKAITLKPNQVSDSVVMYQQNIKGLKIDVLIRTGTIKITHPVSYYTGHDTNQLPTYTQGVKHLEVKINNRNIPILYDHILHADPKALRVMKDITSPRIFIYLTNGDGAGTDNTLWVIQNNKVAGHYDWEYGYDEWSPRNNLDAYPMKPPFDACNVYKISGVL
jgi:hypothetical protein